MKMNRKKLIWRVKISIFQKLPKSCQNLNINISWWNTAYLAIFGKCSHRTQGPQIFSNPLQQCDAGWRVLPLSMRQDGTSCCVRGAHSRPPGVLPLAAVKVLPPDKNQARLESVQRLTFWQSVASNEKIFHRGVRENARGPAVRAADAAGRPILPHADWQHTPARIAVVRREM